MYRGTTSKSYFKFSCKTVNPCGCSSESASTKQASSIEKNELTFFSNNYIY